MLSNNLYMVNTWAGDVKPVKKITFFPEVDQEGLVFYKIEGQLNMDYFMISYSYDKDKAKTEYDRLLGELVEFQEKRLVNY